jgi:hypothetical protein
VVPCPCVQQRNPFEADEIGKRVLIDHALTLVSKRCLSHVVISDPVRWPGNSPSQRHTADMNAHQSGRPGHASDSA